MRAFKVFIFGLLYGWFFKTAFDRIYRENDLEDLRNENASLKDYIRSLEMQIQSKSLAAKSVQRSAPQALAVETPAAAPVQRAAEKDDLKVIKGIGPAIEKKLNDAGIYTYEALAGLSPRDLENILGSMVRRLQDEKELIAQAKKLARQR